MRWHRFRQALLRIGYYPGERTLFGISSLGSEIYGTASVFPSTSYFTVSDPAAVKQASYSRNDFVKNTESYTILKEFGSNLLVVEGEEWKRQRRIAAPAFSDKNNHLVWDTAKGLVEQMIAALAIRKANHPKAGFGQDVSWGTDVTPVGHKLTFKEALSTTSTTMHFPLMLPRWVWGLMTGWSHAKQAHDELRLYLQEMITSRRELKGYQEQKFPDQRHDLFNQLICARDADGMLTEDELIGNVFIFLIAGHETTAHAFAIMLSLLALYPQVQDKLVKQIREFEQEYGDLKYSHMHLLTYAMAVVYETLRLFPMVSTMPKKATADTTMTIGFPPNTQKIKVPKSMVVNVFSTGLHYSPSYWDNPDEFDPERFTDPHWNREAFIPFSLGPRACIGRRFAETALVAELCALISNYRISIDETRFKSIDGQSILQRRSRLINPEVRLTLSPAPVSLVFSERD
ncbi:hypothetical protein OPQ81_000226 [Rhizoctonia solani]|nr:hypothetical protein OPQ81_000226 [Rhizoctonia solani]